MRLRGNKARNPPVTPAIDPLAPMIGASLICACRTAPGGESRAEFLRRAEDAAALVERELEREGDHVVVVSHGGLLNYLLQRVLRLPPRDDVPFGFEHCGVARLLRYTERAFGPFPMLRFGLPSAR